MGPTMATRKAGAKLFFPPKNSPDLNPIEQFSPNSSTTCAPLA